jgi:hypothetical protein
MKKLGKSLAQINLDNADAFTPITNEEDRLREEIRTLKLAVRHAADKEDKAMHGWVAALKTIDQMKARIDQMRSEIAALKGQK